jgi:hypothetical protein
MSQVMRPARRGPYLGFATTFAWASLTATLAHAQPTVVVLGDATCPSEAMIRTALPTAWPQGDLSGQTVTIEVVDDRLALSLGEGPAGRREIPADRDCTVRAESVAVILAAWSGELGANPTVSPVLKAAKPAPVQTVLLAPMPATGASPVTEVEGSAFYSPLWGHGLGGVLGASRTSRDGGLGVRGFGAYQPGRDLALEGGTNQVLRFLVGAALTYQLRRTHVFASGDVGLVGTFTRAQGTGYEPNHADSTANLGGLVDLRGGLQLGRFSLWLNARGLRLAHAETVKVQSTSPGVADSTTLNAWDLHIGAGLGVRLGAKE